MGGGEEQVIRGGLYQVMENNLLAETNTTASSVRLQGGAPLPSAR